MLRRFLLALMAGAATLAAACSDGSLTGMRPGPGQGLLAVRLTDAPLVFDSVQSVNIFVVRVDARRRLADSAEVEERLEEEHHSEMEGDHPDSSRWVTLAAPNRTFNLLTLRNGLDSLLGTAVVDTGHYKAIRLVIDPSQSNVVLKNGTVLTATSTPPIEFFGAGRRGIGVELEDDVDVTEHGTTTITVDFRLDSSFVLRGRSLGQEGLIFRPSVGARIRHDD